MTTSAKATENPLLARLKRRSGVLARWPGLVTSTLFAAWAWYGFANVLARNALGALTFLGMAVGLSATLSVIIFLAWFSANFPVLYMRSAEYEVVCATPLTGAEWVAAYVAAIVYRSRALIWLAVALMPMMTMGMPLPWPLEPWHSANALGIGAWARYVYFTLIWVAAMAGLFYWIICLGVSVALRWREPLVAAVVALFAPLGLWGATIWVFHTLTPLWPSAVRLPWEVGWTAVAVLIPWALARKAVRWGAQWARGEQAR